jgi:hypothetical protein
MRKFAGTTQGEQEICMMALPATAILASDKQAGQGNRHKYTSAATQIRDSEKATATVQSQ